MESGHSVQRGVVANEVQEILTEEQITLLKDCVSKEIKVFRGIPSEERAVITRV